MYKVFKAVLQFSFQFFQLSTKLLKTSWFFTHIVTKNSLSTVYHRVMSFARAASLREKKSAVFSCGLRLRKRAAKRLPAKKKRRDVFLWNVCLYLYGCGWSFWWTGWRRTENCGCRGLFGSAYIPRKAAVQAAGLVSFYEWRMAVNEEEKQKAKAAALYKRRCLQAFKESPKQERAGPHLYMAVKRR